jgi:hypothetical protein
MKKHFIITALAYWYFGFGLAVENLGIKAGLGFWLTTIIWVSSVLFFLFAVLTSLQKIKDALFNKPTTTQP